MAEGNRLPSLENAPHLKTDGEFFFERYETLSRHTIDLNYQNATPCQFLFFIVYLLLLANQIVYLV